MSSPFLSVQEAAKLLCVKRSTIYSWVHKKQIPYRKHGNRLIFSENRLLEWSERFKVEPLEELTFDCFDNSDFDEIDSLKNKYGKTESLASGKEV